MAGIQADPSPIIVDREAGESFAATTITYERWLAENLWERTNGGAWWERVDKAYNGEYPVVLAPGELYEVGVFVEGHGPTSSDPIRVAWLMVGCIWKKPEGRNLISDQNRGFGGTWYFHQVHTTVDTNIVTIGVSRKKPTVDSNGFPHLKETDGAPTAPLTTTNDHWVEIKPLVPGNDYFFAVVVADKFGNWDVRMEEFTTLQRKITVQFQTLHIFNDGDPFGDGEGEFWFRVYDPATPLGEFHLPTQDIDDWWETDRPYPLGFVHLGNFEIVQPGKEGITVESRGAEHDGFLESDEVSNFNFVSLPFPTGRFVETVTNRKFRMDCRAELEDDDFHFGVDVVWSVEYGLGP